MNLAKKKEFRYSLGADDSNGMQLADCSFNSDKGFVAALLEVRSWSPTEHSRLAFTRRWRRVHLEWKLGVTNLMWTLSLPVIFWSTIVIQLLGLGAIVALRLCGSDRGRLACQRLFVTLLLALGLITVLSVGADSDSWVTSGATLSVMTVFATFDFGGGKARAVAF